MDLWFMFDKHLRNDIAWHHIASYVISYHPWSIFFTYLWNFSLTEKSNNLQTSRWLQKWIPNNVGASLQWTAGLGYSQSRFWGLEVDKELGSIREVLKNRPQIEFFLSVCLLFVVFVFLVFVVVVVVVGGILVLSNKHGKSCWRLMKVDEGGAQKKLHVRRRFPKLQSKQMPKDISPLQNLCTPWAYNILHEHHHICNMPWGFKHTAVAEDITWV